MGIIEPFPQVRYFPRFHYSDVIMGAVVSQITSFTIVYWTAYSGADQRKHQSSASLVHEIHRWPVKSPHKWPVTRKMLPFDDIIMIIFNRTLFTHWMLYSFLTNVTTAFLRWQRSNMKVNHWVYFLVLQNTNYSSKTQAVAIMMNMMFAGVKISAQC